ncbi:MAG TPA: ferritin-like domain-containing protein [Flavisolibacter sp.]|nr:ferritin-like domain-containing protein [Flavisolibacter sp.]
MEKMNDLKDLLNHELQDLYSAEEQIIDALPAMIDRATDRSLKAALVQHLDATKTHKKRLEQAMGLLGDGKARVKGKDKGLLSGLFGSSAGLCKGMQGIVEEGNKVIAQDMDPQVLDAAIIACAQKVEHYEICGYGTARSYARELKLEKLAQLLEQTLEEEYSADRKLSFMAESRINREAEVAGGLPRDRSRSGSSRTENQTVRISREEVEMASASRAKRKTASKSDGKPKGRSRNV